MKLLKPVIIAAALSIYPAATAFGQTTPSLLLHHHDGSVTAVMLSERPVVSVDNADLLVTCSDRQIREPLGEIRSFDVGEHSGVSLTESNQLQLQWLDEFCVRVSGASAVSLYSIDGLHLDDFRGEAEINLSQYRASVYIIVADSKTFKITVKR